MRRTVNKCALLLAFLLVIELTSGAMLPGIDRGKRAMGDSGSGSGSGSGSEESSPSGGGGGGDSGDSGDSGDDGDDPSMVDTAKDYANSIPVIGIYVSGWIQNGEDMWTRSEQLTDGALGRILGGALPCTVYIDKVTCTGVTTTSDLSTLVQSVLDPIPGIMLPGFVKSMIVFFVDISFAPTMDLLFGGVPKN